jgi:hypothetical protein
MCSIRRGTGAWSRCRSARGTAGTEQEEEEEGAGDRKESGKQGAGDRIVNREQGIGSGREQDVCVVREEQGPAWVASAS